MICSASYKKHNRKFLEARLRHAEEIIALYEEWLLDSEKEGLETRELVVIKRLISDMQVSAYQTRREISEL